MAARRIVQNLTGTQTGTARRFDGDFTIFFPAGWTGTVVVEKSDDDGDNYEEVESFTERPTPTMRIAYNEDGAALWRLRSVSLSPASDFILGGKVKP